MNGIDPSVRAQLQEAIRQVQVMAGLNDATMPRLRLSRPAGFDPHAATMPIVLGRERLKGPRPGRGAMVEIGDAPAFPRALAIGVTSPDYRDGKSTIAMALASCLAHDFGVEVMLVDADFDTHSVGREYGLDGRRGLADVLTGESTLDEVTNRYRGASLSVITAGTPRVDPARLARSEYLSSLIDHMKAMSTFVVLDLPAALRSSNAAVLASRCDAVLVVARAGRTTRQDVEQVLEQLHDANVLGVVLNRQESSIPGWLERLLALPPGRPPVVTIIVLIAIAAVPAWKPVRSRLPGESLPAFLAVSVALVALLAIGAVG